MISATASLAVRFPPACLPSATTTLSPLQFCQRLARRPGFQHATRQSRRTFTATPQPRSQQDAPQTHYDLFPQSVPKGPPPKGSFDLDLRALRKEFLQAQAAAHPDRHPAELKKRAEATSARINEAYRTLENPLRRAQYILSLRGIDVAEDETLKVDDPALLMEVLETRETIEEAESEEDLEPLRQHNDARLQDSVSKLSSYFAEEDIDSAKTEAVKLRYWVNIKESIDSWEKGKPVTLQH